MNPSPRPLFSLRVRVPGSTANMGPGFDTLGMALSIHDAWSVEGYRPGEAPNLRLEIRGEAPGVPTDERNLMVSSFRRVWRLARRPAPALRVTFVPRLPVAGGLGSSSAAIAAGLTAANTVLGRPVDDDRLLALATEIEGHPDNVAPALRGGFCVSTVTAAGVRCLSWNAPSLFRDLAAVVCTPLFELKTKKARAVLPARVSYGDAVFNVGRTALLVAALTRRDWGVLGDAMEDRLHQPYRRKLIPGFDRVLAAARAQGAWGAALSGAGPTLLALAPRPRATAVGKAMERAFQKAGVDARANTVGVDARGARCEIRR